MRKYLVHNENGDELSGPHNSSDKAEERLEHFRSECAKECGTDGMDENNNGNFVCGVLAPHEIHIQVTENGYIITGDV